MPLHRQDVIIPSFLEHSGNQVRVIARPMLKIFAQPRTKGERKIVHEHMYT